MGYLKVIEKYFLNYFDYLLVLDGYSDVSSSFEIGGSRSTNDYTLLIGGAVIVWKSNI